MTLSAIRTRRSATRLPAAVALPFLLVNLTALQGCDVVTADLKHSETAEWRKTYELAPGGRVEISNINGRIQVEPSTGNAVEIVALKSAKAATSDAAKAALERIEIREDVSASSISVATKLLRSAAMVRDGRHAGQTCASRPRPRSSYDGQRRRGVTGLSGRVTAETTNGGVTAREISGTIDASTTNGGVDVELARPARRREARVHQRRHRCGSRRLEGVDFGEYHQQWYRRDRADTDTTETRRRLEGRLNGGGAPIRIEGTNGGIRIAAR